MIPSDTPSPLAAVARQRVSGVRRLLAVPPGDWVLAARAGVVLVVLRLALLLLDFGTVRRLARRLAPISGERSPDPERTERLVRAVWRASARIPTGRNCLLRSLAVHLLLAREGIRSSLRIGVRAGESEDFSGHAWVEVDGRVVTLEGGGLERWNAFDGCVLGDF